MEYLQDTSYRIKSILTLHSVYKLISYGDRRSSNVRNFTALHHKTLRRPPSYFGSVRTK